jgi:hypothetical protein
LKRLPGRLRCQPSKIRGSDGCLVASAVFKTVESSYAALVGSIPSLSALYLRGIVHLRSSGFFSIFG